MITSDSKETKSSFSRAYRDVLDLAAVRAELISIEVAEQKDAFLLKLVVGLTIFACLFLAILTLLFALNSLLPEAARIWLFFTLSLLFLLVTIVLLLFLYHMVQHASPPFSLTMGELKKDFQALRGKDEEA